MKLSILLITLISPVFLLAQYSSDALLFGENNQTVTARSLGAGNALGALGGDLSVVNTNPAGLGLYRRTELSLSLGALFDNTKNTFLEAGTTTNGRVSQMSFGGAGAAIAIPFSRYSDWKFANIGITINRLSNYAQTINYEGDSEGSRILSFAADAQGLDPGQLNPYESYLAYQAYLIDEDVFGSRSYVSPVISSDIITKSQEVKRRGGVNELGLSVAANYKHKLYIGATVGIDFLTMNDDRYYYEDATNDTIPFETMRFTELREVTGTGINLKLGVIYRVNKMFRFGVAIHTPTAYRLKETFDSEMYGRVYYNGLLQENTLQPDQIQEIQHTLSTPWQFSGSLGLVIAKKAFIGAEVSYQDYAWSNFGLLEKDKSADNNQYIRNVNKAVSNNYKGTFNVKVGGEISFGMARVRLGYRLQTSPYQTEVPGVNDFRHDISAGLGFRWKHFFLDFGYVHTLREFQYIPYGSEQPQRIVGQQQTGQAMLTLGASIFRDDS